MFQSSDQQTAFNQGIAYLMRLDEILKHIDVASIEENYDKHFRLLNVLFKELYPLLKEQEQNLTRTKIVYCRENLRKYNIATSQKAQSIPLSWTTCYDEMELLLRELMQSKGLNMPRQDDVTGIMGGGHF